MKQLVIATVGWKRRLSHTHTHLWPCAIGLSLFSPASLLLFGPCLTKENLFFLNIQSTGAMVLWKCQWNPIPSSKKYTTTYWYCWPRGKKHWLDLVFLIKVVICKSIIYFSLINRHCKITGWNKMWWHISEWWPEMVQRFTTQGWRLWSGVTFLKQSSWSTAI